jgi:hypothetical protein
MFNAYRVIVYVGVLTVGAAGIAQAQAQQAPASQQPSAQQQQQAPPAATTTTAQETVTSADVNDQELEQFAKSIQEVMQIQQDTNKQLEGVQDTTETAKVKQEANSKMAAAVESHGMKVERFNLIARSMNQDTTLKQRVQQKIQELRQAA